VIACACSAQNVPPPGDQTPKSGADSQLTAQFVKTGLFMISGGGCNTLLRLSGNGMILVDGKLPGNYKAILRQAGKLSLSDQPIRALIVTDYLENHNGNNAEFLAAGTQIVAQENVKESLAHSSDGGGKVAAPTITYRDNYTIRLGGVEADLMHFGNAHTNGDTVVYFPNLKVVAVGGLYADTPDPDFAAGGSLVEWSPVLAQVLKLDFDVAVPSSGPMISRAELEAFKNKIDTVLSRASSLVKKGVTEDQFMAQLKTDDLGWHLNFPGQRLHSLYAELSRTN
jgi:glyoxylase-like metal-dependent hydrolase (beta-lactamase superfamily II)